MQSTGLIKDLDVSRSTVQDVTENHPVLSAQPKWDHTLAVPAMTACELLQQSPIIVTDTSVNAIIALWFGHSCLLENMVTIPSRTATTRFSPLIRALRAELGFLQDGPGLASVNGKYQAAGDAGLIPLGLEMNERLGRPNPVDIEEIFDVCSLEAGRAVDFSKGLLSLAKRPVAYDSVLIGLAVAFLDFETAVAERNKLLSPASQDLLRRIVAQKRAAFQEYVGAVKESEDERLKVIRHYIIARGQIVDALAP